MLISSIASSGPSALPERLTATASCPQGHAASLRSHTLFYDVPPAEQRMKPNPAIPIHPKSHQNHRYSKFKQPVHYKVNSRFAHLEGFLYVHDPDQHCQYYYPAHFPLHWQPASVLAAPSVDFLAVVSIAERTIEECPD
jgi:hypothetical protein